jgi:putative oxidoreductase
LKVNVNTDVVDQLNQQRRHIMNFAIPANPALLAARLLLAYIFISAGWGKIGGYAGVQQYMGSAGVPGGLLPVVIAAEIGLGVLIAIGFQTRLAALALAIFSVVAGYMFHLKPADAGQMVHFSKNLAIAGGFLALAVVGAGAWSIDGRNKA